MSRGVCWLACLGVAFFSARVHAAEGKATERTGRQFAVLVACSAYDKSQFKPLPHTIDDVEAFKKALLTTGFDEDHIKVLHDRQPDRRYLSEKAKILKELGLVLVGLTPADTLVVALSGHGVHFQGDATGYFCPLDANLADKGSLIPMEGIGGLFEELKACKAGRKLLIVNACRNDPTVDLAQAVSKVKLDDEDEDRVPRGIAALYSCKPGQKSYYDPERKRGIFFDHVIRSWKGEYLKADEPLTLETFFDQVVVKTRVDVDRTLGVAQVPVVRREYEGADAWYIRPNRKKEWPAESVYQQAVKYVDGVVTQLDDAKAVALLRQATEAGHPLAAARLAGYYHNGTHLGKDLKEAGRLCTGALAEVRRAAEGGHADARNRLGWMYQFGLGVAKDEREAVRWYRKAAEQHYANAQCRLGHMYAEGRGVSADGREAVRWYRLAADQNLPMAMAALANCYLTGTGIARNEREGIRWLRKAAEQHDAESAQMLAVIYENGLVGPPNEKEAVLWCLFAAELNHPLAQLHMGLRYELGRGIARDESEAVRWYRRSAEQNIPPARFHLAVCLETGRGVERDRNQAIAWYRKAALQGFEPARAALFRLGERP